MNLRCLSISNRTVFVVLLYVVCIATGACAFTAPGKQHQTSTIPLSASSRTNDDDVTVHVDNAEALISRRTAVGAIGAVFSFALLPKESFAIGEPDCMSDCLKSCKSIAPKDTAYCLDNCTSYCSQTDRNDGLSGSKSSDNGETGILGINTVNKGNDRPPSIRLPGLDFVGDKGKKLIGY
uniref:SREBP regulating gene protein n=1 Tax=Proboscia inermis TaxID=420281 RepID=A0A7S0GGW7_9STRA|mmetsp:Transcript_47759/g.48173  ORF Transcript_47759/g.48173 Transcript_47759/m.48173 type:complete len:180 (+) Transcript_47759:19-558(+)